MLKVFLRIWKLLTPRERRRYAISHFARLSIVSLDLIGVALVGVTVSVATGTQMSATSATGRATEALQTIGFTNVYAIFAIASVSFFVIKAGLSIWLNRSLTYLVSSIEKGKAHAIYTGILDKGLDALARHSQSEAQFGLIGSTTAAFSLSLTSFSIIVGELVMIGAISVYLLSVNALLFLAMAFYLGVVASLMNRFTAQKNQTLSGRLAEATVTTQRLIQDTYTNFRVISVGRGRAAFERQFTKSRSMMSETQAEISALNVLPRYITEIGLMVGLALLVGQRLIAEMSLISASTLAVFIAGSFRIVASLLPLQGSVNIMRQVGETATLSLTLLEEAKPTHESQTEGIAIERHIPDIELCNVSHSYGNHKHTLRNVTLRIPFGTKVLLAGNSGAGKSTFLDIILGLREVESGQVTIGGETPSDFRRNNGQAIGYVAQQSPLLEATFLENITMNLGSKDFDKIALERALQDSELNSILTELPEGLDTVLLPGALSGGQTQRLAIARALYSRPSILVLDEATSALDTDTASKVINRIFESEVRTVIVVSHQPLSFESWDMCVTVKPDGLLVTN